jgi:hypothetical protein
LFQRKGAGQRNKASVNQHSENPTPKQDSWWAAKLILEPEDNIQTKTATPTVEGADQAAASERQKKKKKTPNKNKYYPTIWRGYDKTCA